MPAGSSPAAATPTVAELTKSLPFTSGYGLGIAEIPLPCGVTVYGHDGGVPGYAGVAVSTKDTKTREASGRPGRRRVALRGSATAAAPTP